MDKQQEIYPDMSSEEIINAAWHEIKAHSELVTQGPSYLLTGDPIDDMRRQAHKLIVAAEIASRRA